MKRSCFKITRQLPVPFVKYSDFEAITEKAQGYCTVEPREYDHLRAKETDRINELVVRPVRYD